MILKGRVWRYGDNVDTGEIIHSKFSKIRDKQVLAEHVMESIDPGFSAKVKPGDIIVAGRYFGCGSSREGAPIALLAAGIQAVVALTFGRIFFRNAINVGLPAIECPLASVVQEGELIEIDTFTGEIIIAETGQKLCCTPMPSFMQSIIEEKGLVGYKRKLMEKRGLCNA